MRSSFGPGDGVGLFVIVNASPFWEVMAAWWVFNMIVGWNDDNKIVSVGL